MKLKRTHRKKTAPIIAIDMHANVRSVSFNRLYYLDDILHNELNEYVGKRLLSSRTKEHTSV